MRSKLTSLQTALNDHYQFIHTIALFAVLCGTAYAVVYAVTEIRKHRQTT